MLNHQSYRFTASLIEVLLSTQPGSQHHVFSAFASSLTRFTITDAIDLEEGEPPLTADTVNKTELYGPVGAMDRLFQKSDRTCNALLSHGLPNTQSARS
jgi:hypothetical protein